MTEITVRHLGLKITIESKFVGLSEQDLYTQAVVSLIRKAKIKEWQSHCEEADETGDEDHDVLDEFCSAVLIAVAHLYRSEDNLTEDKQVKTEKIGNLSIPENDHVRVMGESKHWKYNKRNDSGGDIRGRSLSLN